jgi:hypothetical protein
VRSLLDTEPRPDYQGGGIVNLLASVITAFQGDAAPYPALAQLSPQQINGHRHVVLVVVDGLGYDYLLRRLPDGALARHCVGSMTSVFPATTASAITSFLTGTAPQQHGLTGWHMYLAELGCVFAVLPGVPRYGGVPLGQAGIDVARLHGHVPLAERLDASCVTVSPQRIARSDFNVAHLGAAQLRPYEGLTHFVDYTASAVIGARERRFVYAYWPELDHIGHQYGIESEQALAHLQELDTAFGRLLERVHGRDTLVILTADHGMIDTRAEDTIELEEHPALVGMLRLPLCGERRAAYCYLRPGADGDFEGYVREHLGDELEAVPSRRLVEEGYMGLGRPHPRLLDRMGDYTLLARGSHSVKDWVLGETRYTHVGIHGGLSRTELYVPLILASG